MEKAQKMAAAIAADGAGSPFPFSSVIFCNIGNPQQLGQAPLSFVRHVLAASAMGKGPGSEAVRAVLPADAVARADRYLAEARSIGAYSASQGLTSVREDVADFLRRRDGDKVATADNVHLTDGASVGVKAVLSVLIRDADDGILIPIPQYPLYSASIAMLGGTAVNYYLEEESGWSLSVDEVDRAYEEATARGTTVRAIAIINPGNPTGQVLDRDNISAILKWASRRQVAVLADEVYQVNVYEEGREFVSFRRVALEDKCADVPLFSFHSTSKGVIGECGLRGGYLDVLNVHESVEAQLRKLSSVSLCSNLVGQLAVGCMVRPPVEGDESFATYAAEHAALLQGLRERSQLVATTLNALPGIHTQPAAGAMYLFPTIVLPAGAVKEAERRKISPDTLYCMSLLEETGIVVVPGSGFGQRDGTFHFRTTFLPQADQMAQVAERFAKFHGEFMEKYE